MSQPYSEAGRFQAIYDRQSRVSAIVLSVARIYQPFIELHSLSARFKRKRAAIVLE